jgi:hypothetical protein
MERTVPRFATDEIELYIRTVYSLLRTSTEVHIRTLEEVHAGMNSPLHLEARKSSPDTSSFIYASLRLPECIREVRLVVLGQSASVFAKHGYKDVEAWKPVSAKARRRRCYFDGKETLACYIASQSDIDDVIPILTAYQIEWNKLHLLLQDCDPSLLKGAAEGKREDLNKLASTLGMALEDLERLRTIWGSDFGATMRNIFERKCDFGVRLLSGSLSEYWRATRLWWDNIAACVPGVADRPVYFISSNTHSVINLLSGFALTKKSEIISLLEKSGNAMLLEEWEQINKNKTQSNLENFLYYALKKVEQLPEGHHLIEEQAAVETGAGIKRIPSLHSFDVEAQVIDLAKLNTAAIDPRILAGFEKIDLKHSNALLINIDYPLGFGAYHILTAMAEHISEVLGVYILGKAATLNGVRGDVMIPNVVQDEHSENTYLFKNTFSAEDVQPYLIYGTVLDNQKALSAFGTFLQNARLMDVVYREGYTDIEMEAGPYLSAVFEMYKPKRHPMNEIVNLYSVPFDIGILHYASDTPMSKGKNLGAGALSYEGMDSTYAGSVAILRRIFAVEFARNKG